MTQDRKTGAAWERRLSDYAYTCELSSPGWAWEFLRRHGDYRRDARCNRAGHPTVVPHVSGSTLFRLRRRFVSAERWGLTFFSDPSKTALQVMPFWLPGLVTRLAYCEACTANDNDAEQVALASFIGRRAVLATVNGEQITVQHGIRGANLVVTAGTMLIGQRSLRFHHSGLKTASRHFETVKTLAQLSMANSDVEPLLAPSASKYRDYLVALDGRLEGRTYRDIAEVLYGAERVESSWSEDSFGLKSKLRRAVECGLALMNGGYLDLL